MAGAWPLAKNALLPLALLLVALGLRIYRLEAMAWVPDTYERLEDTRRILAGQLPHSTLYPPGVSVLMALPAAVFGASLLTMQAVTIMLGAALVLLAYFGTLRLTGDRLAAALLAGGVAVSPYFVYSSRSGLYDIVIAFFVAGSVFLLPALRGRGVVAFVAYGALLALLLGIRPTAAVLLPILLIYWLCLFDTRLDARRIAAALVTPNVLATAAAVVLLTGALVLGGNWLGHAGGAPVTLERFDRNLGYYAQFLVQAPVGVFLLVPPACFGAVRLRRTNRPLLWTIGLILVSWPLLHAPFYYASLRYMLTPFFFVLVLAAVGWSHILQSRPLRPTGLCRAARLYGAAAFVLFTAYNLLATGYVLHETPRIAAESDAGLARELSPVLADLRPGALVVSAVSRAFRDQEGHVEFLDLIDTSLAIRDEARRTELTTARMEQALGEGRDVYYLYSHWEAGEDFQGDGREGYQRYFDAAAAEFALTEIFRTERGRQGKHPWILFKVERRTGRIRDASAGRVLSLGRPSLIDNATLGDQRGRVVGFW